MSHPSTAPSYRESHQDKGADYHVQFSENPRRALIWRIEQDLLGRILARFLPGSPIDHLDFACGTGRILRLLEDRARSSLGVDVSPSMLSVARGNVRHAEVIEGDLTRGDLLGERRFNLITAFRFFPNAEPELRRDALAALAARLADGGIVVFNNHHNAGLLYQLVRLAHRGRPWPHRRWWDHEIRTLVAGAGLEILARYHVGVVPETEAHPLRPRALVATVERIASRLPLAALSEDVLYVCGRAGRRAGSDG